MKRNIFTLLLALVTVTAHAIDEYQFHGGTAVLKGRIVNKPAGEWDIVEVRAHNLFSDKEIIKNIPVAADGTFEGVISLPHPQTVLALDLASVFLAVGDTVEVTKDASLDSYEGVTFSGHGTSATINQLWPEVRKHYFVDKELYDKTMTTEDMPEWKQGLVKQIDTAIADIEADRLPLPAGTNAYVKEVIGASLLGEPMVAIIDYFRDHMTLKMSEYYDFVAERERWLLDNPAMLLVTKNPSSLLNRMRFYFLYDIAFMNQKVRLSMANQDSAEEEAYKLQYVLPRDFDADLHRRLLPLREDTLMTIADYYRMAAEAAQSRYKLKKNNDFMMQMVLCQDVFREENYEKSYPADHFAAHFAAAIPLITNPIVAHHATELYRQYVISREGQPAQTVSQTPEADAVFQRIIKSYKGNGLYIDFWDWGCGPCRRDMLDEREKVERMKDLPVRFLYVCSEKTTPRDRAEKWMQENNIKGEHIYLKHTEWLQICEKFQFNAVPFCLAVDKDGNIVTYDDLDKYYQ